MNTYTKLIFPALVVAHLIGRFIFSGFLQPNFDFSSADHFHDTISFEMNEANNLNYQEYDNRPTSTIQLAAWEPK